MPTVQIVEDSPDIAELIRHYLKRAGYETVVVGSGRDALTKARQSAPDLVVLDIMLPDLDGLQICQALRADPATARIPILMLTAKGEEADRVRGLELGADDYVTKPFSLRELTARIRAIFRRAEQAAATQAPPVVDLGRVQVDLAGHRVLRDGQPLPIKPKAFELLAFLVRHPGQVFSRDQLLENVWGYDYAGETRTVDVHVHWLRSELEEDPATPQYLHTVRGVGYVFRRPGG
jgi:two-component system alkaline phosphatase synthesis response regulator PhoP